MWAHYAGSGRGFVLALRMDHPSLKGQDLAVISTADSGADDAPDQLGPGVSPDRYDETRPRTGDLMRNQISYADCLVKGSDWQYEQEWRAFRNLNRTPQLYKARLKAAAGFRLVWSDLKDLLGNPFVLLDVPPDAIHEIITAANMAATEISAIARILLATPSLRHVGLSTARLSSIGFAFGTAQR